MGNKKSRGNGEYISWEEFKQIEKERNEWKNAVEETPTNTVTHKEQ